MRLPHSIFSRFLSAARAVGSIAASPRSAALNGVVVAAAFATPSLGLADASAGLLLHEDANGISFVLREQSRANEFLVFRKGGGATRLRVADGAVLARYEGDCQGTAFAGKYVGGLFKMCRLDDAAGKIVELPATPAFDNAFHVAWLDEDEKSIRFLMNGRPWDTEGYIVLKSVDKETNATTARLLVTDVPDYSGAMTVMKGGDEFLYTGGTGEFVSVLHTTSLAGLRTLAASDASAPFKDVFTERARFEGLSFNMDTAGGRALFFDYEHYLVDLAGNRRQDLPLPQGCAPFALSADSAFALCDAKDIRRFPLPERLPSP